MRLYARVSINPLPTKAPTVVLVHGYGGSSRYMAPAGAHLAQFCRVFAPDLPGFGKSAKPTEVLDVDGLADALAAWMRAENLEFAVFIGNSFGCQVITAFALRHPERIERAVLIGPTVDQAARSAIRLILRTWLDVLHEPPSLLFVQARDFLKAGPRRMIRTFQYMLGDRIEDKLPHVRVPVLVVRGDHDTIVSQRWAGEVARLAPEGRLVVIPDAGHAVNFNSPSSLARVVRWFVESTGQDGRSGNPHPEPTQL